MPEPSAGYAFPPGNAGLWPTQLRWRLAMLFAAALAVRCLFLLWLTLANDPGAFDNPVCRWDCGWYMGIVREGYDDVPHSGRSGAEANWAFFPLFPILVTLLDTVLPFGPIVAGTIVSIVAGAATAPVLYAGYRSQIGEARALFLAATTTLTPFALYSTVPYTEGLFGLLLAACFGAALNRRWLLAGATAILLSATRTTGVLIVLPFAILALQQFSLRDFLLRIDAMKAVLAIAMAPLGTFVFMLFLYHHMGDALAFSHVQIAWDRNMGNPFDMLQRGLSLPRDTKEYFWACCAAAGLGGAAYLALNRRPAEAVWLAAATLLPLSTGLFSLGRYVLSGYTLYLALALLPGLGERAPGRPAPLRLAAMLALLAGLVAGWSFFISKWVEQSAWVI